MRIDHLAYRVLSRELASKFFIDALGYKIEDDFRIDFDDGSCAKCFALSPGERSVAPASPDMWQVDSGSNVYHMPPEIFVSEGTEGSIVNNWVLEKGGTGSLHHIAYQAVDVEKIMKKWVSNGWASFTTDGPIVADGITQCFTKEHEVTGIIYEFIYRTTKGFNINNVRDLMSSTVNEE
jgi:hypothetical protein